MISKKDLSSFYKNGYLIKRKLFSLQQCSQLKNKSKDILVKRITPYELEAELNYPDGPIDKKIIQLEELSIFMHVIHCFLMLHLIKVVNIIKKY